MVYFASSHTVNTKINQWPNFIKSTRKSKNLHKASHQWLQNNSTFLILFTLNSAYIPVIQERNWKSGLWIWKYQHNYLFLYHIWHIIIHRSITLPVVLYRCKTWSLPLREQVFKNTVLRKIHGANRDKVTGRSRKMLHGLNWSVW